MCTEPLKGHTKKKKKNREKKKKVSRAHEILTRYLFCSCPFRGSVYM